LSTLSNCECICNICGNFCEMLNLWRCHLEADNWSQWWGQRWNSHSPSCQNLGSGNNHNWICIHSCELHVSCKSCSYEILPIQSNSWIANWYWCYWGVGVRWKLLILALRTGWICASISWTVVWNSNLLRSDIFSKSLTNYLSILIVIKLLTNWYTCLIN
jgi:hypothetical protein